MNERIAERKNECINILYQHTVDNARKYECTVVLRGLAYFEGASEGFVQRTSWSTVYAIRLIVLPSVITTSTYGQGSAVSRLARRPRCGTKVAWRVACLVC